MMKPWAERLWTNMNMLPGPLWVFGAWGVFLCVQAVAGLPGWISLLGMSEFWWKPGTIYLISFAASLLPLAVVWALLCRKKFAMSMLQWYVLLRLVRIFIQALIPVFMKPGPLFRNMSGEWLTGLGFSIAAFALWFVFLRYLERAEALQKLFPISERRGMAWWAIALMAVAMLCN